MFGFKKLNSFTKSITSCCEFVTLLSRVEGCSGMVTISLAGIGRRVDLQACTMDKMRGDKESISKREMASLVEYLLLFAFFHLVCVTSLIW